MLYENSISIVQGRKKMGTWTFKLNFKENRILLSTGGGVSVTIHNPFMFFWLPFKNLYVMLLMVTRCKLVRFEIN